MASPKSTKKQVHNPFEQSYEFAKDTAKKAGEAVVETFNPFSDMFENPTAKERESGNENFSAVDFDKLNKSYDDQDSSQLAKVREQLDPKASEQQQEKQQEYDYHKRVTRDEEEYLLKKKQEKEEEEREEAMNKQQQKLTEEEELKAQQVETPKGKVRKNILGGGKRKATAELPTEFRPDAGKQ